MKVLLTGAGGFIGAHLTRRLLAAGRDLSPQRLIEAYRHGIFPWFSDGQPVLWWSPDPRCVIVIDQAGRLKADGGLFRTTLIDEKAAQGSQPPATTPAAPARP